MLVEDAKARLEDGVGEVDKIFAVELDFAEDGEAEELPTILLLLLLLLLILVEVLLLLTELLLDLVELLLFLLDVLVLILVSDALNELDVVEVTFLVTFLLAVNRFAPFRRVLSNILS